MPSFKEPTFQERVALAARAKQAALEALRTKANVDAARTVERTAAQASREEAQSKKRDAERAARAKEKADREARAIERGILEATIPLATEAEREAARDARYAPRNNRSKRS